MLILFCLRNLVQRKKELDMKKLVVAKLKIFDITLIISNKVKSNLNL
jgi:hypothetical protein